MLYRPERGWGFAHGEAANPDAAGKLDDLLHRVQELEARVQRSELEHPTKRPKRAEPVAAKQLETSTTKEEA
jgi:hypothetical protein